MVEQLKRDGGTVEQTWWNSRMVEKYNSGTVMVKQWRRDGGTVEQGCWKKGTMMVEK